MWTGFHTNVTKMMDISRNRKRKIFHSIILLGNQFSYDVTARDSFIHFCCRLTCKRRRYNFLFFICSLSLSQSFTLSFSLSFSFFSHWINLFTAFPHLRAYATINLNIETHSGPIVQQLWNAWADHNPLTMMRCTAPQIGIDVYM